MVVPDETDNDVVPLCNVEGSKAAVSNGGEFERKMDPVEALNDVGAIEDGEEVDGFDG